jgi:hypothetical protein
MHACLRSQVGLFAATLHPAGTFLLYQPSPSHMCLAAPHNATAGGRLGLSFTGWTMLLHTQRFMLLKGNATTSTPAGAYLIVEGLCVVPACMTCNNRSRLILAECDFISTCNAVQRCKGSAQARWQYQSSTGKLRWLGAAPNVSVVCLTAERPIAYGVWMPVLTAGSCDTVDATNATRLLVSAGREHASDSGSLLIHCKGSLWTVAAPFSQML